MHTKTRRLAGLAGALLAAILSASLLLLQSGAPPGIRPADTGSHAPSALHGVIRNSPAGFTPALKIGALHRSDRSPAPVEQSAPAWLSVCYAGWHLCTTFQPARHHTPGVLIAVLAQPPDSACPNSGACPPPAVIYELTFHLAGRSPPERIVAGRYPRAAATQRFHPGRASWFMVLGTGTLSVGAVHTL